MPKPPGYVKVWSSTISVMLTSRRDERRAFPIPLVAPQFRKKGQNYSRTSKGHIEDYKTIKYAYGFF